MATHHVSHRTYKKNDTCLAGGQTQAKLEERKRPATPPGGIPDGRIRGDSHGAVKQKVVNLPRAAMKRNAVWLTLGMLARKDSRNDPQDSPYTTCHKKLKPKMKT